MLRRGKPVSRSQSAVAFILSRCVLPSRVFSAGKRTSQRGPETGRRRSEAARIRRPNSRPSRRVTPHERFFCFAVYTFNCYTFSVLVHVAAAVRTRIRCYLDLRTEGTFSLLIPRGRTRAVRPPFARSLKKCNQ